MIPSAANSDYPKFVADQVLTSDNLNDLFGYLDEQGRMTRTYLSGIGIVCGLKVKTAADGSSITISKGVGVTSSGYLVSVPEIIYTKRTSAIFDAVKSEYYNRFVNIATKTQKFNLWELKQEAEAEGNTALTKTFLTSGEKIVLLFVELLEENNKNCDPNSCDDKGINVTVNFRPLLIEKANVEALLTGAGAPASPWLSLPDLTMKRFDVTANPLFECLNFFDAYRKILNTTFLNQVQTSLTKSYDVLQPLLAGEFPTNPFASLANDFKFLNDGSITPEQLIFMQYYYDLFSDLILAYNEFREKGTEFIGMCCPDDLFPRHLLLDLAIPDTTTEISSYRHYFIPSPILSDQEKTASQLKILFKKLVLLVHKFAVPPPTIQGANKLVDTNIRITPSILANVPFSSKSIPYYYSISGASDELLKSWSPLKYAQGKSSRNLSYHAKKYNTTDEDIYEPLLYDLEPYNFLRIEGHIGKSYQHVVKNITDIRDKNRLPFEIVALNADVSAITAFIKELAKVMTSGTSNAQATLESIMGTSCHFNDLELLYDSIMAELTGKLSNEMKFFYDLKRDAKRPVLPDPSSNIPQVPLLKKTDAAFRFTNNSIGHEFELFYANVKDFPLISLPVFFQSFGQDGNNDVMDFVFKAVLYYIEMLYETVTTSLSSFTFYDFYVRYYTLIQAVRYIKLLNKFSSERFPLSEEENDHLDAILSITADNRMVQLYIEFLRRILQIKIMQQAGFYALSHPGIQHKAGVPLGGTFILIYHEAEKAETSVATNVAVNENLAFRANADVAESAKINSGAQRLRADASTQEHLMVLSADVNEKVVIARERIITGLKKTINTDNIRAEKAEKITAAAAEAKASKTDTVSEVTAVSTTTTATAAKTQDINQRTLSYLADAAAYLKNRKADKLDEAISEFNDGVVIADFYLPYLCCSDCPPIQMIVTGEPEKPNQPPVARPGDNVSVQLPANTVTLDGSTSSDPDGTVKTYVWELQSGPEAKIENPAESKTNISLSTEGTYVFKLTVTDDDGATSSATVTVTVLPLANVPPVARGLAKPDLVALSANGAGTTQLIGSESTDSDGKVVSYVWSLSSGPTGGSVINNPDNETTLVIFTQPGTYVFKLVVKDDKGATDTTTVTVTVTQEENKPPVAVANAEPSTLVLVPGQQFTAQLIGKGSADPDGSIASYNWSLSSGPTSGSVINNPNSENTLVSFNQVGVYQFRLTVTDDKGATDATTVTITVTQEENKPPVAVANADPLSLVFVPGRQVTAQLIGKGSADPDGTIASYNWSLSSGPTSGSVISNPNNETTLVSFNQPGTYQFKLTVTDNRGATDATTVTVTVTQEIVVQKTCATLDSIISNFGALTTADTAENFKLFTARYVDYKEIRAFYNLMVSSKVQSMTVDDQIKFFIEQKIESRLATWIDNLKPFLLEFENLRLLALLMLHIHTELAYYISCIQKDDVNKAEIPMVNTLTSVNDSLNVILRVVANFPDEHRKVLGTLQAVTNDERNRLKSNDEINSKPTYVEILAVILKVFKEMAL
ncbi:MAG: tandem-95 repeat protein [Prolixibacteraceae bacterium]|nr:tandem-95 repeat protein [Prolixibacteraceae bacterium]